MRMDQRMEKSAADVIKTYSEQQLHQIFEQYGEVRNSRQLAKHIAANRNKMQLNDIASLKALIAPVIKGNPNRYLAQLFQALRIEVNDEMGALKEFLDEATKSLKAGGRLSIITFHSLEDRTVKQFIKRGNTIEDKRDPFGREETKWVLNALNQKSI